MILYIKVQPNGFDVQLPSIYSIIIQLGTFAIASEFIFYFSHRLLHKYDTLYNNIHYIHHEINAPLVLFTLYTHPIEYIFANFPTVAFGPLLLGSHFSVWIIWTLITTLDFCNGHSGWHLPYSQSAEFHDYHHSHDTDNYGTSLQIFDTYYKTNKIFKESYYNYLDKRYKTLMYGVDKILKRSFKNEI